MSSGNPESLMAQWFRRVWNEEDVSAIEELSLPNLRSHGLVETIEGREAWYRDFYLPMRAAFSEVKVELLEETIADGKIFGRLVARLVPKCTNEQATMHGMCIVRIENDKLAEAWDSWDFLGLLSSMKLVPMNCFARALSGNLEPHPAVK